MPDKQIEQHEANLTKLLQEREVPLHGKRWYRDTLIIEKITFTRRMNTITLFDK